MRTTGIPAICLWSSLYRLLLIADWKVNVKGQPSLQTPVSFFSFPPQGFWMLPDPLRAMPSSFRIRFRAVSAFSSIRAGTWAFFSGTMWRFRAGSQNKILSQDLEGLNFFGPSGIVIVSIDARQKQTNDKYKFTINTLKKGKWLWEQIWTLKRWAARTFLT